MIKSVYLGSNLVRFRIIREFKLLGNVLDSYGIFR